MKRFLPTSLTLIVLLSVAIIGSAYASFRTVNEKISPSETREYWEKRLENDRKILKNYNDMVKMNKETQLLLNKLNTTIENTNTLLETLETSQTENAQQQQQILNQIRSELIRQLAEQRKLTKAMGAEDK